MSDISEVTAFTHLPDDGESLDRIARDCRRVDGALYAAGHKNLLPKTARFLSLLDDNVRQGLASNPATPLDVLLELTEDRTLHGTLAQISGHPELLSGLAQEADHQTVFWLMRNTSTPLSVLLDFTKLGIVPRMQLAQNVRGPNAKDVLDVLLQDSEPAVRHEALRAHHTGR